MTAYFAERAWLGAADGFADNVLITTDGERITDVAGDAAPGDAHRLPGLVVPGLVNAHSHAFHRALRGATAAGLGDFWTWREQMYAVAGNLTPDTYLALARATYAEMALTGITTVAEFHYLHHDRDGKPYADPNAMGHALTQAAAEAGIRLVLLDTCYLQADVDGKALSGPQLRFTDGDADRWAERVSDVDTPHPGAAIHSVRGCPPEAMRVVANWAKTNGRPLHLHLSEQVKENKACQAVHGMSPTELCADTGVLGDNTTAVHATHLSTRDISLLGSTRTGACFCPTTERDLADGIGPAARLVAAGARLSLGSDSHAVIDLFEEARAVELNERLATNKRGGHQAADLLAAATEGGAHAAGLTGTHGIRPGALADLVAVRTDTVRMAGAAEADPVGAVVFAATGADVAEVVAGGRLIVKDGRHVSLDVPRELKESIAAARGKG
ncbi:formimidoylglutamate deiminase [Phytomonospora endophytica]|uniref:Formiminoglutamate deiminase n=1 Tax=Phytomonospora endophytica TaxID=714109 RepID=A0A841FN12_9ACTN|nr:formimidoylglutamate deiminase [Phytomonospora endophytica]MBB6036293.1 formiminoglutamate deiminase [Phytomonospora endophytica]GIG67200.1 formimidoylglutamate deiminase [Phytomonospora endophytica]